MQGLVIIMFRTISVSVCVPVLVLNGPNLNTLGERQPSVYGRVTLSDIEATCRRYAHSLDFDLSFRQSNDEGQLITWVQESQSILQRTRCEHGRIFSYVDSPDGCSSVCAHPDC